MPLDLALTTTAGMVSLWSVPCLVLVGDGNGDGFLLGHDVLKRLGIDVNQQRAQLAGPSLLDGEVDEVPVGADIPDPVAGPESACARTQMVDRAVANALQSEYVGQVPGLLDRFPDVWREAVGVVPPAEVEILRVT
ncbi:hypothetical protein ON010_g7223 [Phytophthora cinnamomi]|nr:hypothetical protein ON010_g7223 [Phytophthora cinnamomi]